MGTRNHATQWRVILTTPDGTATAVARIPRLRLRLRRPGPARPAGPPGTPPHAGTASAEPEPAPTLGRVTVIIPAASLDPDPPDDP